jgi:hypothetical protein
LSIHDFAGFRVGFDEVVDLSDDVAFQASDDVTFAFPFSGSPGDVSLGRFVVLHTDYYCPVDRCIELSVTAMVDAVFSASHP